MTASSTDRFPGTYSTLVAQGHRSTWEGLGADRHPASPAAHLVDGNLGAVRAVWSHLQTGGETLVAAARRIDDEMVDQLRRDGFSIIRSGELTPPLVDRAPQPELVWLLTSGTTGRPKRVPHTIASLSTVAGKQPRRRWLCPYSPGAYAWWQMVTLCLLHPEQDVVFVEPSQLDDWPELALAEGVTAVSGTPTFWRQAVFRSAEVVAQLPLQQLTLGGEPVDQAILDQLAALFPYARISWIYASSEAGATIAVHDRRAGFPVEWLERATAGRPRLSLDAGELLIDSPYSAGGFQGPIRTGDRVEVVDDRVLITGRLSTDEINVGGAKVSAATVRAVLLSHPDVAWAHVSGRRSPLVGQVVVADVVLRSPVEQRELNVWCVERLPEYAVPRRLRVLTEIPLKETLKSDV